MTTEEEQAHIRKLIQSGQHLFIEASAGSGKTTRLVNLVAEIIAQEKATISQILCVTFTEKAAAELKARIYEKLRSMPGEPAKRATENFSLNAIGTIHSFCLRSLGLSKLYSLARTQGEGVSDSELFEEARAWVYREIWTQLDADELARHLHESDFGSGGNNRTFDQALRSRALWCFSMNSLPLSPPAPEMSAIANAAEFFNFTLAAIVRRMHEIAETANSMSFSRMITLMAEAVKDSDFAATIRQSYHYALIDEFQDTDEIQWQIFRTLFLADLQSRKTILVVVGDPKQAIYKFRGADVFVYLRARTELMGLGALTDELTRNYRSVPEILHYLNDFFSDPATAEVWSRAGISYSPAETNDKVVSTGDDSSGTEIWYAENYSQQSTKVFCAQAADRISAIRAAHPDWTIAVIAFKHRTLAVMADALRARAVEYAYYGEKPDVRRLDIEHLKVFVDSFSHETSLGLAQANTTVFMLGQTDALRHYEYLGALLHQGKIINFLQALAQNFRPLHAILEHDADPVEYHAWRTLFENLLNRCGKDIVDHFTLRKAVAQLKDRDAAEAASGDMLRSAAAVQLLTVQSSKGLDWNLVVLADGESDKRWRDFPFFHDAAGHAVVPADIDAFDSGADKLMTSSEESQITQLNLLYVALTRAKHKLLIFAQPALHVANPGPTAAFLYDQIPKVNKIVTLHRLPDATTAVAIDSNGPAEPSSVEPGLFDNPAAPLPLPQHKDVPLRILKRESFSSLSKADFTAVEFADDILPRGAETGQLLHTLLETCDFSGLKSKTTAEANAILQKTRAALEISQLVEDDMLEAVANRILEIVVQCANASLPLVDTAKHTRLSELPQTNLWREMPFYSSADTHAELRRMPASPVTRIMTGFMDMVFTPNDMDYYILDYKSNSLAGVAPADLDDYIKLHYDKQREIYGEALQRYLQELYPESGRRVRGCYFLFLRYLKSGETTGVQFKEYAYV
ncbi:UvrD-helicase domain-containing protein [Turneriella parva]|uniref:DNA 3'-5' helicase n=1 Tax=Turneriella parva (strain ATCC BAA-1111 / DSM 21527 / NCTC 11395 / H) TaxID=869212 RepID=I4B0L7_TURPD|nr:UvrD-helicase domain-containing protein [Turneriella parva]AFM10824.1 DNA helicase/exodeoxyribonuclease V, beta subunit [Turneriella parva DSM 21527]